MSRRSQDRRSATSDAPRPDRRSLRFIHGTIAYLAIVVGLPLALVGAMAMFGGVSASVWVRLGIAGVVLLVIPLVLADRLLPKDPGRRKPGLVRDVFAGTWTATALSCLALAGPLTAEPLQREASRLDEHGWARAAYLAQWMAGPSEAATTEVASVESLPSDDAPATEPSVAEAPAAEPPPATEPPTEAGDEAQVDDKNDDETSTAKPADDEAAAKPKAEREYSSAELFSTYAPSVVSIKVSHHGFRSGGTGFIIDDQGTIATNHHVIEDASEVEIKTFDGVEIARVELLASDAEVDLALLRVDPDKLGDATAVVALGDSETVEVGEPVSVIGNPLGLEHTLTNGIVSARRVYEGKRYIQMSAPISPGNSGGPVFDHHGRVIAVSVATMFGGQNLNLAVPVSQLEAMIADEYPNSRSFGASSW